MSAKEILGNRSDLSKWQDDFHAHMVKAYPQLERGESALKTGRKHIPPRLFKQSVNLTKQAQEIQTVLDSMTPFNASKKRDEVAQLLMMWFPQMESFEGQLKKYRKTIDLLERENSILAVKASNNEDNSVQRQLEVSRLQSEVRTLRRFVDAIPPDVQKQLQAMQRGQRRDGRKER